MILFNERTDLILKSFYNVYNKLGYGFLEKVYENALAIELSIHGLNVKQQSAVKVFYNNSEVGCYFADIIVNDEVILELKSGKGEIMMQHELQLINYLKATLFEIGLILHFGEKPTFKRKILTNNMK